MYCGIDDCGRIEREYITAEQAVERDIQRGLSHEFFQREIERCEQRIREIDEGQWNMIDGGKRMRQFNAEKICTIMCRKLT